MHWPRILVVAIRFTDIVCGSQKPSLEHRLFEFYIDSQASMFPFPISLNITFITRLEYRIVLFV